MPEEATPAPNHEMSEQTTSAPALEILEKSTSSPGSEMSEDTTPAPKPEIPQEKATPKLIGCLLDVSGSMKAALETGRGDERAIDRLRAVIRATIKVAQTEQRNHPDSQIFVGAFGLSTPATEMWGGIMDAFDHNIARNESCPPVIDLCGAIDALLGDHEDRRSGHELLIDLANSQELEHITKYIEGTLTDDEARIVFAHLRLHGQRKVDEFVDAIPPQSKVEETMGTTRAAGNMADVLIDSGSLPPLVKLPLRAARWAFFGGSTADRAEAAVVDNSEASRMAKRIARTWLNDFRDFQPRKVSEVIRLLQRLEERTASQKDEQRGKGEREDHGEEEGRTLLDTLRGYLYGLTPMQHALETSLSTFRKHKEVGGKILIMISDGVYTDEDPAPIAQELKDEDVTLATVYLTEDSSVPREVLHDRHGAGWHDGQRILFDMASRIRGSAHPVPVLASTGWRIPSSGECALYATVCSPLALDEFCGHLLSARFKSAELFLDLLGRWETDKIVNDDHVKVCNNPSSQGGRGICYAHAAAAVAHMALLRIVGREGGIPEIGDIRKKILAKFPERKGGQPTAKVLEDVARWYPPLKVCEVKEDGARQAVLRRRPVLATFRLSDPGWKAFGKFFKDKETRGSTLTIAKMQPYRHLPPDGGHAVVMTDCAPGSLTFLNSWGYDWGDNGSFSVEGRDVNGTDAIPFRFYDVFWYEKDLKDAEREAYRKRANEAAKEWYDIYGLKKLEAMCPHCRAVSAIGEVTNREAVCPMKNCGKRFVIESEHLFSAYMPDKG